MTMHSFFIFIFVVIHLLFKTSPLFASDLKSKQALTTEYSSDQFIAELSPGFHFNEKAPNQIKTETNILKPSQLSKNKIRFLKLPQNLKSGIAALYVCDDANTFCETHRIELKPTTQKYNSIKKNLIYEKALQEARIKNKLVLLRFTARWCPGCVRYESEILPSDEFKNLTKNFIVTKIDVDLFENANLSEQFKISGIPCLVFLNNKGQEIDRIVDFQEMLKLKTTIAAIEKNPTPARELEKLLNSKDTDFLGLGRRLLATGNLNLAVEFFKKINPPPPELIAAEVQLAHNQYEKDPSFKAQYIEILKRALKNENSTSRSLNWRTELIGVLDPQDPEIEKNVLEAKKVTEDLLANPSKLQESLLNDSPGELVGYEKLAVILEYIDLLDTAKKPVDEAFQQAAKIGSEYQISPKKQGPARRYLIILNNAKKYSEAETYAELLLKETPSNFDIQRRLMKIKLALKKPQEAIDIGEKILPEAEGRNYFWVAESLAKAYLEQNGKNKARSLLKESLSRSEISSVKLKDIKTSLEELYKKSEMN